MWQQMGRRNNGLRKPFSFQTVSKQHQRCAWQWWRHPTRSRPSQNHVASVPFSTYTASSSSRELGGWRLWSLCKAKASETWPAAAAAAGACGGPDSACMAPCSLPLPHSSCKAAGLACLGWVRVRIGHLSLSPAAEKKITLGKWEDYNPASDLPRRCFTPGWLQTWAKFLCFVPRRCNQTTVLSLCPFCGGAPASGSQGQPQLCWQHDGSTGVPWELRAEACCWPALLFWRLQQQDRVPLEETFPWDALQAGAKVPITFRNLLKRFLDLSEIHR